MFYKQLKEFPQDFLWSASTSAYQVEGAYNEDYQFKIYIIQRMALLILK